jgi:hypothetical protein
MLIYYLLASITLANTEIENLKSLIIKKGAALLIKVDVDDEGSYKELLRTQYEFILKEEIKQIII